RKACGGKDKLCDNVNDDTALIGWDATCPDFESRGCNNAINNCDDIGTCLTCIAEQAVDQSIDLYYRLRQSNPKTEKAINKCQITIGKSSAAFFASKSKALQKCWNALNKDT